MGNSEDDSKQEARVVDSETGEPIENADIEMVDEGDESRKSDLVVRVVDSETGEPIEGAKVTLHKISEDESG